MKGRHRKPARRRRPAFNFDLSEIVWWAIVGSLVAVLSFCLFFVVKGFS